MTELVQLPHFVSVENLTVDQINALIDRAEYFKQGGLQHLNMKTKGMVMM